MHDPASTVLCLPGLGANLRLFEPQLAAFEHAFVPAWPVGDEDMQSVADLADRMLDTLVHDGLWPEDGEGPVLVGFSFGGQVALCIAKRCVERRLPTPRALVLVSTPRSAEQITPRFHSLVKWSKRMPPWAMAAIARMTLAKPFARMCKLDPERTRSLVMMAGELDGEELKTQARLAGDWDFTSDDYAALDAAGVEVLHIHANEDPVIPAPPANTPGLTLIDEKAHLLTWTHADAVNAAIGEALATRD